MAFIRKSGNRYCVRQGNNNVLLRCFGDKKKAEAYMKGLHRKHKPSASNRGKNAAKKFRKKKR